MVRRLQLAAAAAATSTSSNQKQTPKKIRRRFKPLITALRKIARTQKESYKQKIIGDKPMRILICHLASKLRCDLWMRPSTVKAFIALVVNCMHEILTDAMNRACEAKKTHKPGTSIQVQKRHCIGAFQTWAKYRGLAFADAFNAQ
jgi:hypothetical protein